MIKNKSDAVIFKNLRNISKLTTTPDGWKVIRIQEGFDLGRGRVINQNEIDTNPGIYPVFSSQTHNNGQMGLINSFDFDGEYLTWTTDGANAGTVFYRIGKFNCTNVCGTLKARHGYCAKFFLYHLNRIAKNYVSYVGNPKLMNDVMGNIVLTSPPYSVQCRIADILGTVDDLIEKTEAAIDKYQAIKTGIMQDLFTRGIDTKTGKLRPTIEEAPELYKESELGWIPKEWEIASLSEVCGMKSGDGITSKSIDEYGRYPVYGGNGLRGYSANYTHEGSYVLIGRQGALCGNVKRVDGIFYASEHAVVVSVNSDTNVDWLSYILDSMNLNTYSEASAQPGLAVGKILRLRIRVPQLTEQRMIASVTQSLNTKLEAETALYSEYNQIKQGLMADLLTGTVKTV